MGDIHTYTQTHTHIHTHTLLGDRVGLECEMQECATHNDFVLHTRNSAHNARTCTTHNNLIIKISISPPKNGDVNICSSSHLRGLEKENMRVARGLDVRKEGGGMQSGKRGVCLEGQQNLCVCGVRVEHLDANGIQKPSKKVEITHAF